MGVTVYGIPGCDTVRKARRWLDDVGLSYGFHDYKRHGAASDTIQAWCNEFGWQNLINRRGTTWRKLSEAQRADLDQDKAVALMLENTSLIKRPVLEFDGVRLLGFDEELWRQALDRQTQPGA